MKKFLFFMIVAAMAQAEEPFSGAGMIFAKPVVQPAQPVSAQPSKPIPEKTDEACETCNGSLGEKSLEELAKNAFDGEYETENGEIKEVIRTKPDFLRREVMGNPMYRKKWYVKRYYHSMKALNDELDAKEARLLEEAVYKGDAYERELKERLRIERPFVFNYPISEEDLEKELSKNPQNVMYQILRRVQIYPNAAEMTEENRQNIRNEMEQQFKAQSGLSLKEFDDLQKKQRVYEKEKPAIKGENLFESSVYFQ